jgi:hypothetical protein
MSSAGALAETHAELAGLEVGAREEEAVVPLPELSEAEQEKYSSQGLDLDDRAYLYDRLRRLLHTLTSHENQEELENCLTKASLKVIYDESYTRSGELFSFLTLTSSKRGKAEGNYGLACLAAIRGDAVEVVDKLRSASDAAGENTLAYLNRTRLDDDFDGIRATEEFRDLMSGKQPVPVSRGLPPSLGY